MSGAGIAANGSVWGFTTPPDGVQTGFVQTSPGTAGSISMPISGLTPGVSYAMKFYTAQRPNYGPTTFNVAVNGSPVGSYSPPSTGFTPYTTSTFTASSSTATVSFSTSTSSTDLAAAIDMVTVIQPPPPATVPDYSFETPEAGTGLLMTPAVSGITFTGYSGIMGVGGYMASAADGDQAATVWTQHTTTGSMQISVSGLVPGVNYVVRYYHATRSGYAGAPLTVTMGSTGLGVYTPGSTTWAEIVTPQFTATSSTATLTFASSQALNTAVISYIDYVRVIPVP